MHLCEILQQRDRCQPQVRTFGAEEPRSPEPQSLLAFKPLCYLLRQLAGRAQRAGRWTAQQKPQGRPAGFPLAPLLRKQTTAAVSLSTNPAVIIIPREILNWKNIWLLVNGKIRTKP